MRRHKCSACTITATARASRFVDGVGNLRRQPLLELRPAREHVDRTGDFAEPDNTAVGRQVGNLGGAVERQQMVLAQAGELDVAHQHQVVVPGAVLEHASQVLGGGFAQAAEELGIGPGDATRRVQ